MTFIALAFGLSGALWLVPILGAAEPTASLTELKALFGPAVAAAIVSGRVSRLGEWAAGIGRWRVPLRWSALALGLPLAYASAWHLGLLLVGSAVEPFAWAFVFTWLYNHTRSTLLCIALHGGINAAAASLLLPPAAVEGSVYMQAALTGNLVVILVAVAVAALTRGTAPGLIGAPAVVSTPVVGFHSPVGGGGRI